MRKIDSAKSTKPWLLLGFLACLWLLLPKSANSQSVSNEVPLALSSDGTCNPSVESRGMSTWLERDQAPRGVLTELYRRADAKKEEPDESELRKAVEAMWSSDKALQRELNELVKRCGWPTVTQYGSELARSAVLIALHAGKAVRGSYLPVIEKARQAKELDLDLYAKFVDKTLLGEGKSQRYGTQIRPGLQIVPFPIEDESSVDLRRASLGLSSLCVSLERQRSEYGGEVAYALCKRK